MYFLFFLVVNLEHGVDKHTYNRPLERLNNNAGKKLVGGGCLRFALRPNSPYIHTKKEKKDQKKAKFIPKRKQSERIKTDDSRSAQDRTHDAVCSSFLTQFPCVLPREVCAPTAIIGQCCPVTSISFVEGQAYKRPRRELYNGRKSLEKLWEIKLRAH